MRSSKVFAPMSRQTPRMSDPPFPKRRARCITERLRRAASTARQASRKRDLYRRKEFPPCRCRCCPKITTEERSYKRASSSRGNLLFGGFQLQIAMRRPVLAFKIRYLRGRRAIGFCATRVEQMRFSASLPQFRGLLAMPFLAMVLAFPASAETGPNGPAAAAPPGATAPGTSATSPSVSPATSGQNTPPKASPSTPATGGTVPQAGQKSATPSAPANGSPTKPEAAEATPSAVPEKPKSSIVINIDKAAQEMTVFVDGVEIYSWPVSTGMTGYL